MGNRQDYIYDDYCPSKQLQKQGRICDTVLAAMNDKRKGLWLV